MLVLSRKLNEDVVINGNITIKVIEIRGDKVRLGIDAPSDVCVDRWEVSEAKKRSLAVSELKAEQSVLEDTPCLTE